MKASILARLAPVALAVVGAGTVALLVARDTTHDIGTRVPGMEVKVPVRLKAESGAFAPTADLRTFFARSDGIPADLPGAWPRFRGPEGTNVSDEQVPLVRSWSAEGPKVLWSVECGEGYAGAAVLNGRVYLLDYDEQKRADALRCLSLEDGKEIWRRWYVVELPKQHGMSRTVPTVTDRHVVTMGPKCHVMVVDANTGDYLWGRDLVREYGTKIPPWYTAQCPLVDGNRLILAPAGRKLMVALNLDTLTMDWETDNPHGWQMTHSSVAAMDFAGRRMYVYCADAGVVGVWGDDGKIAWEYPGWTVTMANVPMPIPVGDGRIFLCGGYGSGCMMLQLREQGGRVVPEPLWRRPQEVFGAEQQTPVLYDEHIYGVITKDAGKLKEQLTCLDLSGNQLWTSGRDNRFGPYGGPYMIANGMIFAANDDGVLTLAEAVPSSYKQIARAKVLQGKQCWAPMALAGGRLLIRDVKRMVCLDLRANP